MDFHSLARKELQALCKLNKIPANMTNIAMADALKSLEIVKGIEDFLNPSESITEESSIDSPERNVVNSPKIPPTGRRTSTRRNPVGEESESVQITTKSTRRMTRRAISGDIMEEVKSDIPKTPAVRSTRKTVPEVIVSRMDIQSKESEVPETPTVVPNSRRKSANSTRRTNVKKEQEVGTVQRVYSTRGSARLPDKKLVESIPIGKEMNKAIKIDLIASEISENDLGEVSDNMSVSDAGNDSQTVLQESVNKSDSVGSEIVIGMKEDDVQEETGDNEVDEPKAMSEEILKALNESDAVKSESAGYMKDFVEEETGDNPEVGNEILDLTEVLIDENLEEKAFDMQNQVLTNNDGGNDSQTVLQELVNKSDSVGSEIVIGMKEDDVQEETGDNEVDEPKAMSEEILEALNESDAVKSESAGDMKDFVVEDETGDNPEVGNEILGLTEVLVDENLEEKAFDMQNQVLTNNDAGNDSQTVLQESVNKSDSVGSEIVIGMKEDDVQEETGDNEVDEPKAMSEEILEALNEPDAVKSESAGDMKDFVVEEETGDNPEVGNEILDLTEVLVDENLEEKAFDMQNQVLTNNGSNDFGANLSLSDTENPSELLDMEIGESLNADKDTDSEEKTATDMKPDVLESEVTVFPMDTENPHEQLKFERREEFNSDKDVESDVLNTVVSSFVVDAEADSDFMEFDSEKEPTISEILNCNVPKENADQPEMNSVDSSEELDSEKSLTKELGSEAAATDFSVQTDLIVAMGANDGNETKPTCEQLSKSPASVKGNAFTSILADDPLTNQCPSSVVGLGHIPKTPTIKKLNHVSDDKENIDHSGRKIELTKEKAKTNKKENDLNEKSLRELNKLLKEKLAKVTKARPALQNLSEN